MLQDAVDLHQAHQRCRPHKRIHELAATGGGPLASLAAVPLFKCDPSLHNLSLWHKVLRLARVSEDSAAGACSEVKGGARGRARSVQVQELRLRVVQIARKQRNLSFAERMLREGQASSEERAGYEGGMLRVKMETALLCLAKKQEPLALQHLWDCMVVMENGMARENI